jgi:hypothetical protein
VTAEEWDGPTDLGGMVEFAQGRASERQLRLFLCACARRAWSRLSAERRKGVATSERYADGLAGDRDLAAARRAIPGVGRRSLDLAALVASRSARYVLRPAVALALVAARAAGPWLLMGDPDELDRVACRLGLSR